MSMVMSVFLDGSRMPTAAAWAHAIRSHGFDMGMDDFDVGTFSGFLPCTYNGGAAGFEYSRELVSGHDLDEDVVGRLGARDVMISLVTHSSMRELMTSTIASAVLCAVADGVLWDTESNEFVPSNEALRWGAEMQRTIQPEL